MSTIEIFDLALSHVNHILSMINDKEQVEEYKAKKAELEVLIEIEREKQMRIVRRIVEEAEK